jgi:toxin FitB
MRYLLDTNVLSEPARPRPDARVTEWLDAQSPLDLAISVITLGEIEKGVTLLPEGAKRDRLHAWVRGELPRYFSGRMLPLDERIARAWGRLSAEGRLARRELPVIDGFLLATADVHELTFVTRDIRDCGGRGIVVFNPWTGEGG